MWQVSNQAPPELRGQFYSRWFVHRGPEYARDRAGKVRHFAAFADAIALREKLRAKHQDSPASGE